MSVDNSKIFMEHYAHLLNQPEAIHDPKQMLETLNETFEALGSFRTSAPKQLNIDGRTISVNSLKKEDVQTFAKLTKTFLHQVKIPEKQAEKMRSDLEKARKLNDAYKSNELQRLVDVEEELSLRSVLEPEKLGDDIGVEANNRIQRELKLTQDKAREQEKKINPAKKERHKLLRKVGIGLIIGGAVVFGVGLAALIVFMPFSPLIVLAVMALTLPSMIGTLITIMPNFEENSLQKNIQKFVELEKYKKYVAEPEFVDFAKNGWNEYERLKVGDNTFYAFLDLYSLQRNYERALETARTELSKIDISKQPVHANGIISALYRDHLSPINQLRRALWLQPLPTPNYSVLRSANA